MRPKSRWAFSREPLPAEFRLVAERNEGLVFHLGKPRPIQDATWGQFEHHAELDFSAVRTPGRYVLKLGNARSLAIQIGTSPYLELPAQLLEFMRQQRCGYNPWLEAVCHPYDGRTAFGPLTNGTYLDARGGWHDAADLLKYLLTSGNATAQMLLAYELGPKPRVAKGARRGPPHTDDQVNDLGQAGTNGIPDLLDEARWGLEWMLKLPPRPNQLYHRWPTTAITSAAASRSMKSWITAGARAAIAWFICRRKTPGSPTISERFDRPRQPGWPLCRRHGPR
jgi:hypothetical protein